MQGGRALETLTITGGRPLAGTLAVQGSKNAVLPILAATAAIPGRFRLSNCPPILDAALTLRLLRGLGVVAAERDDTLSIDSTGPVDTAPEPEAAGRLRSSVLLLGALLTRRGQAEIPLPGGCVLGARPLDLHLSALERLGVRVRCEGDRLLCRGRPRGGTVLLRYPSVGATENLILAALSAAGPVRILGAAREPEICDLAAFLNACGARISGAGTACVRIEPAALHGAEHRILPDRMEAATWLCAAAAAGGELRLTGLLPGQLAPVLELLRRAGCTLRCTEDSVSIRGPALRSPGSIRTGPYPAFPTDAQAPVMAALLKAEGTTLFEETVFSERYRHVPALCAMGARIELAGALASVRGVPALHGAELIATDLRGAAAMAVAALAAEGETRIRQAGHLDRGYGAFAERLRAVGAAARAE